jgi:hypothetical protein
MEPSTSNPAPPQAAELPERRRTPEAERALAEAQQRREQAAAAAKSDAATEIGGRAGPDPVRYGDWENGGIASDF